MLQIDTLCCAEYWDVLHLENEQHQFRLLRRFGVTRPENGVCISCIYQSDHWEYVTAYEMIEQLFPCLVDCFFRPRWTHNSLRLCDDTWHRRICLPLIQVMTPKPYLNQCWLIANCVIKKNVTEIQIQDIFFVQENCLQQNGSHLVQA